MAKKPRKLKTGDVVTIEIPIIDVYEDMGIFTADIAGKRTAIPCNWDQITNIKPYNPKSAYDRVR